eukprot:TRINITY_DN32007_c0_g1_i1.p1 TRINITY_DN32007_c0_g1~~TRINITY_DN32007_c0_g1_i1.p1  ORF type:complete len:389 (+),score=95.48 TRINITY_DN32007_c0_g1_i1:148-1167(+)
MRITALDAGTISEPLGDLGDSVWHDAAASCGLPTEGLALHNVTPHGDNAALLERCSGSAALLTNKVPIGAAEIAELRQRGLGLIVSVATGYNQIDVAAAREHGVTVCNIPGYAAPATAQHTVALLLALCNGCESLSCDVRSNKGWVGSKHFWYALRPTLDLHSATVGFVGWGQIAQRVARILRGFEPPSILAYTPSRRNGPDWPEFSWAGSVDEVFERSDAVLLHCPQTPQNTRFVNAELLARMKQGAVLVNTARGGLVDEAALAEALSRGHLRGAAVDVVSVEPMDPQCPSPLMTAPNCIVTPHMAALGSRACRELLVSLVLRTVAAWASGSPINVVS